jgi:hypothetical protein
LAFGGDAAVNRTSRVAGRSILAPNRGERIGRIS